MLPSTISQVLVRATSTPLIVAVAWGMLAVAMLGKWGGLMGLKSRLKCQAIVARFEVIV